MISFSITPFAMRRITTKSASLSRGNWGGVGMNVGSPVTAILYGIGRGSVMLYNGQEVGEPADGRGGFWRR